MSKVDWSKAPEGAEFFCGYCFCRRIDREQVEYYDRRWMHSTRTYTECMQCMDYEPRPREWPSEQAGADSNDGVSYNAPERTTSDLNAKPVSKYHRTIKGAQIDVYDVIVAYGVTCPALAHALKKMLMPGQRHAKTFEQDIDEAIASLRRAKELAAGRTTN